MPCSSFNNDLKRIKTQSLRPFSCSHPPPPTPAIVTFRTLTVFLVTLKNFLTKKPPTQSIEDSDALLQFQSRLQMGPKSTTSSLFMLKPCTAPTPRYLSGCSGDSAGRFGGGLCRRPPSARNSSSRRAAPLASERKGRGAVDTRRIDKGT